MNLEEEAQLGAMLQALLIAVSALLATHPQPDQLRTAFEQLASQSRNDNLMYRRTLATLRKSIR